MLKTKTLRPGRPPDGTIRVAARSKSTAVAGSIAGMLRDGRSKVLIKSIGAGAINQALKAVAIAESYLNADEAPPPAQRWLLLARPTFFDVVIPHKTVTGMTLEIEMRLSRPDEIFQLQERRPPPDSPEVHHAPRSDDRAPGL